jgi:inhibitor of cysteine peptidase
MTQIEARGSGTVEADVGDEVVIRLPENATTGYLWSVALSGGNLEVVGDTFTSPAEGIGSGGERMIRVRGTAAGRGDVTLRLGRPWEDSPVEERLLTVVVR